MSMSFSAKRWAYSDMPSVFEPVRNLLHRGPVACASGSPAGTVYPSRREFEGRFLAGPMFLPSLLAIADEVIQ